MPAIRSRSKAPLHPPLRCPKILIFIAVQELGDGIGMIGVVDIDPVLVQPFGDDDIGDTGIEVKVMVALVLIPLKLVPDLLVEIENPGHVLRSEEHTSNSS